MNRPALAHAPAAPADAAGQEHHATSTGVETINTYLAPEVDFPTHLAELALTHPQVLHSRSCLHLNREYLKAPEGAHPVTMDRHQEPMAELTTRHTCLPVPADE